MNYFAHGIHCLDEPYRLAGTAVPDWLSVADRRVRLRPRYVEPHVASDDPIQSQIAVGVMQHFRDDDDFHRLIAFFEISGELTRQFRQAVDPDDGFRCSFLGHIVTELLLDSVLIEQHPDRLDEYYTALRFVDREAVQRAVNAMSRKTTSRLAMFIDIFLREEFLRDYLADDRLLFRLNQVMQRVRLPPLPKSVSAVFQSGRNLIRARTEELLPTKRP